MTTLSEAAAHWREWLDSGDVEGGAARVHEALESSSKEQNADRVRVLYAAHLFAFRLGEPSRQFAQETLDLARQLRDVPGECLGLTGLARAALRDGDYAEVARYAAEGVQKAREAGDPAAESSPLHLQAAGTRLSGNYELARELYLESVALADRLGDERMKQMEFHNLGWVELHRGDVDAAEQMFDARNEFPGLDAYGDAWEDLNAAAVALARGERDEARTLFERGRRQLDALGVALDPDDQSELDWLTGGLEL